MSKRINSRAKGKAGELELAAFLRERGFEARRGVQFSGGGDSPDVVHSIDGVHIECKRTETSAPYKWLAQARQDADGKQPVVAHRRSREEWIAILPLSDYLALVRELQVARDGIIW